MDEKWQSLQLRLPLVAMLPEVTQIDLDLVNEDLEKDGEKPITLEHLNDLRESMPDWTE